MPVRLVLEQAQGLGVCPGLEVGLGEAAPPDRILEPQDPFGMPQRQRYQPIAPLFFRAYCGAGLVIQCLARFPLVGSRVQRPAERFIIHAPLGHALLLAHLGGEGQRPHPRGLAIGAR